MRRIVTILIFSTFLMGCKSKSNVSTIQKIVDVPSKVTIEKNENRFQLLVNNKQFYIKGAGLEFGRIASVAHHHGNSFRTWRTDNGKQTGKQVLDEAYKYGLMVTMGIDVARERHGFDYNNEEAVKAQKERIRKEVTALKDHPALLIWAIGNELNLRSTNPKVWDAVNDISKMIHQIDPNHLTTTTLAGISQKNIDLIKERCTDLDLLSFQVYGKLQQLPKLVKEYNWDGPYMVTEWGPTGHWEVSKTEWGAPIEENSTIKAANYLKRYKDGIQADSAQCIGSYVFLWGQKQERTPTWYGILLEDGQETESVDVMHFLWSGKWPLNRTPQVQNFTLNNKTAYENVELMKNEKCVANLKATDFEKDKIKYRWEILQESTSKSEGGDFEKRPDAVEFNVLLNQNGTLIFKAPSKKGAYRLFGYVSDGHKHEATANIPFLVN
jgi:hypothetical protein